MRNSDRTQVAIIERAGVDSRKAFHKRHTCQPCAAVESIRTNGRNARRQHNALQIATTLKRRGGDRVYRIRVIIIGHGCRNSNGSISRIHRLIRSLVSNHLSCRGSQRIIQAIEFHDFSMHTNASRQAQQGKDNFSHSFRIFYTIRLQRYYFFWTYARNVTKKKKKSLETIFFAFLFAYVKKKQYLCSPKWDRMRWWWS